MNYNNFAAQFEPLSKCARVVAQDRNSYLITIESVLYRASLRGSLRFESNEGSNLPVVGDFVQAITSGADLAVIERVLPRKNLFARRAIDESRSMQPIAANLDTLFVTVAVNRDFNLRRVERYVVAAEACLIPYAVLLTKIDLVDEPQLFVDAIKDNFDSPILTISAIAGEGIQLLEPFRGRGKTIAFVGSSGVGKSTLINSLLGNASLDVGAIRVNDDRGRHTTSRRLLLELDDGTAIIDTPGMREFALADAEKGLEAAFAELSDLAVDCRFRDCRHDSEPGCAVRESVDGARLKSFRRLQREAAFEARKNDPLAQKQERAKWKAIHKEARNRIR